MKENKRIGVPRYFAATNGYQGFISYFGEIFASEDFSRIYVLKGGPGTGKSSFMKRISEHFSSLDCYVEEIYCSSDPHSLDGVIIANDSGRIALLDGTAPHERDAAIPGAIDEIINLGDGWDERFLVAQREEILSLSSEKSRSYKAAYSYLKIAGASYGFIKEVHLSNFDRLRAKNEAERLFGDIPISNVGSMSTRLISSFGRYGEQRLDTLDTFAKKRKAIGGSDTAAMLFIDLCIEVLRDKGQNMIRLPYALDGSLTEGIFLVDRDAAILRGEAKDIDADEFISLSRTATEQIKRAEEIRRDALEEAKRWFAIASDLHFRLEEIYGRAMNFDKNNELLAKKLSQIENILEIV